MSGSPSLYERRRGSRTKGGRGPAVTRLASVLEMGEAVAPSQASDETTAPGLTSQADVEKLKDRGPSNHNRSPPAGSLRVTGVDWG